MPRARCWCTAARTPAVDAAAVAPARRQWGVDADPGHQAAAERIVGAPSGQRAQLQEGGIVIEQVRDALPRQPHDVPVSAEVLQEQPALALTGMAETRSADLLVIGSHGKGEQAGLHLGSVAGYCVHHAPCPVLIYRTKSTGR